jgi:hypothetical protein
MDAAIYDVMRVDTVRSPPSGGKAVPDGVSLWESGNWGLRFDIGTGARLYVDEAGGDVYLWERPPSATTRSVVPNVVHPDLVRFLATSVRRRKVVTEETPCTACKTHKPSSMVRLPACGHRALCQDCLYILMANGGPVRCPACHATQPPTALVPVHRLLDCCDRRFYVPPPPLNEAERRTLATAPEASEDINAIVRRLNEDIKSAFVEEKYAVRGVLPGRSTGLYAMTQLTNLRNRYTDLLARHDALVDTDNPLLPDELTRFLIETGIQKLTDLQAAVGPLSISEDEERELVQCECEARKLILNAEDILRRLRDDPTDLDCVQRGKNLISVHAGCLEELGSKGTVNGFPYVELYAAPCAKLLAAVAEAVDPDATVLRLNDDIRTATHRNRLATLGVLPGRPTGPTAIAKLTESRSHFVDLIGRANAIPKGLSRRHQLALPPWLMEDTVTQTDKLLKNLGPASLSEEEEVALLKLECDVEKHYVEVEEFIRRARAHPGDPRYVQAVREIHQRTEGLLKRLVETGAVNGFPYLEVYTAAYPKLLTEIDAFLNGTGRPSSKRSKRARGGE